MPLIVDVTFSIWKKLLIDFPRKMRIREKWKMKDNQISMFLGKLDWSLGTGLYRSINNWLHLDYEKKKIESVMETPGTPKKTHLQSMFQSAPQNTQENWNRFQFPINSPTHCQLKFRIWIVCSWFHIPAYHYVDSLLLFIFIRNC